MQHTPHSWSSFTLMCFPNVLAEFFQQHQAVKENKAQLKRSVEEEYRKWKSKYLYSISESSLIAFITLVRIQV